MPNPLRYVTFFTKGINACPLQIITLKYLNSESIGGKLYYKQLHTFTVLI